MQPRVDRCDPSGRVVLTVSGTIDPALRRAVAAGSRPHADYLAIADTVGAELLDRAAVSASGSRLVHLVGRLLGPDLAMAVEVHRRRREWDVVITDGEQIGLPLALASRFGARRRPGHVMIGHRLTTSSKRALIRFFGLARGVDEVLVYATRQRLAAEELFQRDHNRVRHIDFMVDTRFFAPSPAASTPAPTRPLLSAAGLEFRDYGTLIEAVRDLDVDVVIGSASPWSKRADTAGSADLPPNVTVSRFTHAELRDLFDRSTAVVVPLEANDFQAGVTTILEAMAMAVPVICTRTEGQTDVVVDGENGWFVPVGDVVAMREAIRRVTDDPDRARAMGRRGRELVLARADVRDYAQGFARIVAELVDRQTAAGGASG